MIELNSLRRILLPTIETLTPRVYAVNHVFDREYAGVIDMTVEEARTWFSEQPQTYPNNLAALKYLERDGERVYESGSYAYRPQGYWGTWQIHFRLFEYGDNSVDETSTSSGSSHGEHSQTALFVHWEKSALKRPRDHYNGVGWDADQGVGRTMKYLKERKVTLEKPPLSEIKD